MANHYGSTSLPHPPLPRGAHRPAVALVVVALAAVAVCLAAAHSFGSATSSRGELAFSSLGLIPFHKPYPADIDDDRSWGDDDYNALHSYDELGGADNEIINGADGEGYINPAVDTAATGRVQEVALEGTRGNEKSKHRLYHFPVFKAAKTQMLHVEEARRRMGK